MGLRGWVGWVGREVWRREVGRGWREEEEEEEEAAAAVLELMSACQIRNTMHLRQRFTEKKKK